MSEGEIEFNRANIEEMGKKKREGVGSREKERDNISECWEMKKRGKEKEERIREKEWREVRVNEMDKRIK